MGRRVVVTDLQGPLAQRVLDALRHSSAFEVAKGIVTRTRPRASRPHGMPADVETIPVAPDHRPFAAYLRQHRIDTVIQCGLAPDRSGRATARGEADVIGTMCTGAAVASEGSPVRSWVVLSSSGIYPVDSHASLLQRESGLRPPAPGAPEAALAEAEDYARDVAIRHPHIDVAILRLQQLAGGGLSGPLAKVLMQDPVPVPIGFDPPIQLLHADDAVAAIAFAVAHELPGVYNVASSGHVRWHAAARLAGERSAPVLPVGAGGFDALFDRLGVPHLSDATAPLARYGQAIDTAKLERVGFHPKHDQYACLEAIRDDRKGRAAKRSTRRGGTR